MTQIYVKRSNIHSIYVYGCSQKIAIELLNNYGYEPFSDEYHNQIINNYINHKFIEKQMKRLEFLRENKINEIHINNLHPFKTNKNGKKLPVEVTGTKWSIFNIDIVNGITTYTFTDTYVNLTDIDNLIDIIR